jgi:hypothetical protein
VQFRTSDERTLKASGRKVRHQGSAADFHAHGTGGYIADSGPYSGRWDVVHRQAASKPNFCSHSQRKMCGCACCLFRFLQAIITVRQIH